MNNYLSNNTYGDIDTNLPNFGGINPMNSRIINNNSVYSSNNFVRNSAYKKFKEIKFME